MNGYLFGRRHHGDKLKQTTHSKLLWWRRNHIWRSLRVNLAEWKTEKNKQNKGSDKPTQNGRHRRRGTLRAGLNKGQIKCKNMTDTPEITRTEWISNITDTNINRTGKAIPLQKRIQRAKWTTIEYTARHQNREHKLHNHTQSGSVCFNVASRADLNGFISRKQRKNTVQLIRHRLVLSRVRFSGSFSFAHSHRI